MTMTDMMKKPKAANEPFKLAPPLFQARCTACWILFGVILLVVASFVNLGMDMVQFLSWESAQSMGRFLAEFGNPNLKPVFLKQVAIASLETLAMSALGTVLAVVFGLLMALPAARLRGPGKDLMQTVLNVLRSIPEMVWAALLLIAAGLGPFAGTLALAIHTTGVLGRLYAESIENADPGPAQALVLQGAQRGQVFWYATLPQISPQVIAYALYRWENNIRAAAILGVVGAGGLGQMLSFHLGLFQMSKTATVLLAMILLVLAVDWMSLAMRRKMA